MIRDAASQAQVNAADPRASTWLSANAGSGKTRVLTDRVARLLLEGVSPQNVLCLTYTKAAAAEMQNRLFQRLGAWAMTDDDALLNDLQRLGVEGRIDPARLSRARTLFASAIETPGGLKIQTIHSFCASILRRFPLEAQVSPNFTEMEDRQASLLRMEVLDELADGPLQSTVSAMLHHFTGAELDPFLAEITKLRDRFAQPLDLKQLKATLDLDPKFTSDDMMAAAFGPAQIATLKSAIAMLRTGGSNDNKAANLLAGINLNDPRPNDLIVLENVFLFGEKAKSPFGPKVGALPTKGVREKFPEATEDLNSLMEVVAANRTARLALGVYDRTCALHAFAQPFVAAYEARKLVMGMLDFEDLISKARDLLTDRQVAEWVLFRLDGGIDHVLVDEAQDTSPSQWAVIKALTQEFVSGEGARSDKDRTIFVVGDKKQSIYSFQGADPDEFDRMQSYFATALRASQNRLEQSTLAHSFRSSQAVLRVVDETFTDDRAAGLGRDIHHIAFKDNMPGRVDLWPVVPKSEETPKNLWYDPVDDVSDTHHTVILANQIADEIKRMICHETLPVEVGQSGEFISRRVTAGDVLILVQRRSELFSEIIRACKNAGLPIAGADRLRVGAELAVKDIAALLSFLALPEDDLSLASALRSPLFGWSEKELYQLAQPRPAQSYLWAALRDGDYPQTRAILDDLLRQADFLRPYDLIERILTRHDGRRRLLARLGSEAEDGIDALLSQALAYERNGVPSLTGFLTWMETDDLEIKRQMDSQGDRIRVMSVHGAKGLEAPIVILPDCAKRAVTPKDDLYEAKGQVIWRPTKDAMPASVLGLRDDLVANQTRERMRLLYVAMTRAEKWLIVAAAGDVGENDESWYSIVADGIEEAGAETVMVNDMQIRRVSALPWQNGTVQERPAASIAHVVPPVFGTLPEIATSKTLSPSDLGGAKIMPGDPAGENEDDAKARGTAIHLLLEHLPKYPEADQTLIGRRLLSTLASSGNEADHQILIGHARRVMTAPHLRHLFADDALAEIDVTADLPELNNLRIFGTIDRLLIDDSRILAVDYKTNRLVPDGPDQVPEGVLRQQGAYAAALAQIYPNHEIETAILWTETATLMPLPAQIVAAALARVTTS